MANNPIDTNSFQHFLLIRGAEYEIIEPVNFDKSNFKCEQDNYARDTFYGNENDLLEALNSGKVRFAGLDVFVNEPTPDQTVLSHEKISLSPHSGASTLEAQDRIGTELAQQIASILQIQ